MTLFGGALSITGVSFLLFCVVAIAAVGYALGRITIKGVALETAGVFLVALVFGCVLYPVLDAQFIDTATGKSSLASLLSVVETLGLILFVTSVGFIAGPRFFGNMKKNFKSYVLLGLIIIATGGLTAVGCIFLGRAMGLGGSAQELTAVVAGLLSGALTSTPAFTAAKETVGAELEAVVSAGYAIAYIFGVVGVVLFVQLIPKITKADMAAEREKLTVVDDGSKKATDGGKLIEMDSFGFMPFMLAAVIGIFIGKIAFGTFSLTTTGGCLFAALILGHFGKIGKISLMPKEQTLKVFRELGLMLFLIGAGISGGAEFVAIFDPVYFVFGIFMTIVPMIVGFLFAKYVLKLSLFNNLGSITGGMTSTPALGTLISVAGTENVAAAYAATYPIALIAVVLVSQFLIILF
ncbi:MAG: permease [Ruminococcaceae bacterium]|nr:permease [Oscillospiraceae bacterium]